jgi:hypothetical protein
MLPSCDDNINLNVDTNQWTIDYRPKMMAIAHIFDSGELKTLPLQ